MIKITLPDGHYYDEMLTAQGEQRQHYNAWWQWFRSTDQFSIRQKKEQAELLFHRIGITFNVYGEDEGTERLILSTACRVLFPPASGSGLTAASASG